MRVALPWLGYACGDCRYCNSGWETLCESSSTRATRSTAGFAEYAIGYARHVVASPTEIDPLDAAPLTCAGVTTYKAVKVSGAGSSDLVAVFGAGGLGHLAIQYAAITGAAVVAVDVNPSASRTPRIGRRARDQRRRGGPRRGDPAARRRRRGDLHRRHAAGLRAGARRPSPAAARLVCVGLPAENEMKLPIFETVLGGLTVAGSIVGTHRDLEEVFALHRAAGPRVERVRVPARRRQRAIEQVLDGSAPAPRMVFDMRSSPSRDSHEERAVAHTH